MNPERERPAWRIVAASAGAAGFAALALFGAVLPAEFGYDPLGVGAALGIKGLSRDVTAVLAPQEAGFATDEARWVLSPFESFEYKYRLEAGAGMVYAWAASDTLLYELHSEPDGAEPGYAESFDQDRAPAAAGAYVAPFPGIHGWFWENRSDADVTLTLQSAGFYAGAFEYFGGMKRPRAVRHPPPGPAPALGVPPAAPALGAPAAAPALGVPPAAPALGAPAPTPALGVPPAAPAQGAPPAVPALGAPGDGRRDRGDGPAALRLDAPWQPSAAAPAAAAGPASVPRARP